MCVLYKIIPVNTDQKYLYCINESFVYSKSIIYITSKNVNKLEILHFCCNRLKLILIILKWIKTENVIIFDSFNRINERVLIKNCFFFPYSVAEIPNSILFAPPSLNLMTFYLPIGIDPFIYRWTWSIQISNYNFLFITSKFKW